MLIKILIFVFLYPIDRPPGYDQLIHPPTYYEALEADGRFDAEDNYNESNYDVSIVYQLPLENDERYSTV